MQEEVRKSGSGLDLVMGVWKRRRWLALVVFAAPFSGAVGLAMFLPSIYESSARVLVERQQVPEAFVKPTVTGELDSRLRTIGQEVQSHSRLHDLIKHFDLYPQLRGRVSEEALVERMRRDIGALKLEAAEPGRGGRPTTVAFTITYQGRDPQTVAAITNALASAYIEENLKVRGRQATATAEFLKAQLAETKRRLDEQEGRVSEFKRRYIGELPQQMPANLMVLERHHAQLSLTNTNLARTMERRDGLLKQLAEVEPSGPAGSPDAIGARIARLRENLTELQTKFTERYPEVIRVKAEIASLEGQLLQT
ncbi:MAG: GumC family protein, partial [Thermoanaerobaculia bacterium]